MGISYRKLFELMEIKEIKKFDLRKNGFSPTIVDRLVKNNNVNTSTIIELCKLLDCQPADIMEYVPDEEETSSEN
ncbi:MAG: helix-turn-helix transcriptional regulator [Oscillospiraceae bacterium]|nr:helix-turn-helix transcriptional regulator [Oscillospiraceae bacterium]